MNDYLFWIAAALICGIVVILLLRSLTMATWTGGPAADSLPDRRGASSDLAVYRAQLAEVERDLAAGVLPPDQAAAARLEIQRRLIRAAERAEIGADRFRPPPRTAVWATAAIVPAVALGTYLFLGTPGMPDMPLAERLAEAEVRHAGERARFEQLTVELAMRLRERPKDVAGWIMLGRAERLLGRYDASIDAFGGAIAAAGGEAEAAPDLLADLAESRVYAAGGIVEEAARRLFDAALARDPGHLKSRHYIAVARSQAGDDAGALALMRGIAAETPPDAPWLPALHQRMAQLEQRLGPQVAAAVQPERPAPRPDSTPAAIPGASTDAFTGAVAERGPDAAGMAAAETMAPEEREAFIRGMVERLADRLAAAPDDPEGWVRLGRAQAVLGDSEAARRAFERAATTWRARLDRTGSDAPERTEIENSLRQVEALL